MNSAADDGGESKLNKPVGRKPAARDEHDPPGENTEQTNARPAPTLLEFLVCPVTKTTLVLSQDRSELISRAARLAFPIRDGIPLMTTDTARDLTDEDLQRRRI